MIETTVKTKLLGILGMPLEHTISPQMHSYMAKKMGIETAYLAFEVAPEDLVGAVRSLLAIGALGFNITSPHKIAVMEALDEIDPAAQLIGTVNTIVNRGGKWYGYNTDGDGFVHALPYDGVTVEGKDVLIIGAGGSARSVSYSFATSGANSVTVTGRTQEKADVIVDMLRNHTNVQCAGDISFREKYDIVVNTTPLGMHPHEKKNPFDRFDLLKDDAVVCDLIYNPKETVLLQEAKKQGFRTVNGLGMLVLQGIYAYQLFIGAELDTRQLYGELMALFHDFRLDPA